MFRTRPPAKNETHCIRKGMKNIKYRYERTTISRTEFTTKSAQKYLFQQQPRPPRLRHPRSRGACDQKIRCRSFYLHQISTTPNSAFVEFTRVTTYLLLSFGTRHPSHFLSALVQKNTLVAVAHWMARGCQFFFSTHISHISKKNHRQWPKSL